MAGCQQCGGSVKLFSSGKPRKWCSGRCQVKNHYDRVSRRPSVSVFCRVCKKTYQAKKRQKITRQECDDCIHRRQVGQKNREKNPTIVVECVNCEGLFHTTNNRLAKGQTRCDSCRYIVANRCVTCDQLFIGLARRKYCSNDCERIGKTERHKFDCKHCGNVFFRNSNMKKYFQFCTRECAFAYNKTHHIFGKKADQERQARREMGGIYLSLKRLSSWWLNVWGNRTGYIRKRVKCKVCQCVLVKGNKSTCSEQCNKRLHKRLRKCTERRRRRRMRDRPYDVYDAQQIFERDGYMCHICNNPTNQWASVPDNDAPTIDHVLPVSKGGTDTLDNVRCAHFRCNWMKNDKVGEYGVNTCTV